MAVTEKKNYMCSICGAIYPFTSDGQKAADTCSKSHHLVSSISGVYYYGMSNSNKGYPQFVDITMNDGAVIKYRRV